MHKLVYLFYTQVYWVCFERLLGESIFSFLLAFPQSVTPARMARFLPMPFTLGA